MLKELSKNGATAVVDTFGGELINYTVDGINYVWGGNDEYWPGRAPVLFPVVGALIEDKVKIEGSEYIIGKHGFARKSDFALVELGDDFAVFELKENESSLEQYPYAFTLRITQTLIGGGFKTEYKVINTNEKDMIFCIGAHAGFNCPLVPGKSFTDYELIFNKSEDKMVVTDSNSYLLEEPTFDLVKDGKMALNYDDYDRDVVLLTKMNSDSISFLDKETKKGFRFDMEGFQSIGVWTPPLKKAPFVCLEPWVGLPASVKEKGDFTDKPYAVTLKAGEEFEVSYKMTII